MPMNSEVTKYAVNLQLSFLNCYIISFICFIKLYLFPLSGPSGHFYCKKVQF